MSVERNKITDFHVRLVERRVNEVLGGAATIRELVALMVEMGWTPPSEPIDRAAVLNAEASKV